MEPEETKPASHTSDVFITSSQEAALAKQINTEGMKLFKMAISGETKYVVAKTRHRALLGAANEFLTIDQVSERDLMRMLRQSFPDLVKKAGEARQMTLPFNNEETE